MLSLLQAQLDLARSLYDAGLITMSIVAVSGFGHLVLVNSGDSIPNVWRANDDITNVAGLLRSRADALRFSLIVAANRLR